MTLFIVSIAFIITSYCFYKAGFAASQNSIPKEIPEVEENDNFEQMQFTKGTFYVKEEVSLYNH